VARVGALANIVCESAPRGCNGGGQARQGTRGDLANELTDGLRLDKSSQEGNKGSFGELHFDYGIEYNECGMNAYS
jgi:hypothetical protein